MTAWPRCMRQERMATAAADCGRRTAKPYFAQLVSRCGKIGQDFGGHFAATSPGPQNARQGQAREGFGGHYSRISSVKRFLSFIPAAPRMVRIDFAVRPCRPITLPRSAGVNAQLQHGDLLALHGANLNVFWMIHESFRDGFNQLLHGTLRHSPRQDEEGSFAATERDAYRARSATLRRSFGFARKLRTVSLGCAPQPSQYLMRSAFSLISAGFFRRIVRPHDLDEAAVAWAPLVDHHDAITRHLLLAKPCQTNRQHSTIPPDLLYRGSRRISPTAPLAQAAIRRRESPGPSSRRAARIPGWRP